MKHCILALIFFLAVSGYAQAPANSAAAQEVLQIEKARVDALVHNDFPALEKIFAADLTYVHSTGVLESRTEFLDKLRSGERKYESMQADDGVAVRSYGGTAIVTGATKVTVIIGGKTQNIHLRFTETWLKRNNQWQLAAWQATKLAD